MHPLSPLLPYELWLQIRKIRDNDQVRDHLKTHLKFAASGVDSPWGPYGVIRTSNSHRLYLVRLLWMEEHIELLANREIVLRYSIKSYYKENGVWHDNDGVWPINRIPNPRTFEDYQDNEFGVNYDVYSDDVYSDEEPQGLDSDSE